MVFDHHGTFFFLFLPKWGRCKKNYKSGASWPVGTTLPRQPEVVPTWHDFVHIIFF